MKPACGPPSSLSPEKVTRSAPSATASPPSARAPGRSATDRPACRSRDHGPAARCARASIAASSRSVDLRGETLDAVVRGVDLQHKPGLRRRSRRHSPCRCVRLVVPTSTSRAPARAMMSGMRNAPPISISSPRETIASRPLRQRVEHEQHRGGVVVDDRRVLGAGELAQQRAHMIVALAALAGVEVEFQRNGRAHGRDRRLDRRLGEQRAAEIGVQHRAGEIEHRTQARARVQLSAVASAALAIASRLAARFAGAQGGARRVEHLAHRRDHGGPAEAVRSQATPASAFRTSSTEGRARKAKIGRGRSSRCLNSRGGTDWRRRAGRPLPQQKIESQRRNVVGDRIERGALCC